MIEKSPGSNTCPTAKSIMCEEYKGDALCENTVIKADVQDVEVTPVYQKGINQWYEEGSRNQENTRICMEEPADKRIDDSSLRVNEHLVDSINTTDTDGHPQLQNSPSMQCSVANESHPLTQTNHEHSDDDRYCSGSKQLAYAINDEANFQNWWWTTGNLRELQSKMLKKKT